MTNKKPEKIICIVDLPNVVNSFAFNDSHRHGFFYPKYLYYLLETYVPPTAKVLIYSTPNYYLLNHSIMKYKQTHKKVSLITYANKVNGVWEDIDNCIVSALSAYSQKPKTVKKQFYLIGADHIYVAPLQQIQTISPFEITVICHTGCLSRKFAVIYQLKAILYDNMELITKIEK